MPERRDALTQLVQQHVGTHRGGRLSVAAFVERAVDPETGYRPSNGLVGKIVAGETFRVAPPLISALAVGLDMPRVVVAAAAHLQLIGYEEHELAGAPQATLLKQLGADIGDAPKAKAVADRWAEDDATEQ